MPYKNLLTFATAEYREAAERLKYSAMPFFTWTEIETPASLPARFFKEHSQHFEHRRGFGYWLWKPHIIARRLAMMEPEDVLMYCDSQCVIEADPKPLFDLAAANGGIGLFHQKREGHKNSTWTRGDCFRLMGCDEPRYWTGDNLASTFSVWRGTDRARAFVNEWLKWCENFQVVSDAPSTTPNKPDFKDHRHDQSVASLLAIKHDIHTLCDPSQWGDGYRCASCKYPRILRTDRRVISPYLARPSQTSSIVEVSALATCPLRCSYCPQDALGAAYKGPELLTLDMFRRCLDNCVPGDAIYFAGFTEPAVNPEFRKMIELCLYRGHRTRIYTTARGMKLEDAKAIAGMDIDLIVLHLPDAKGNLSHAVGNIPALNTLATHPRCQVMAMDNVPHPDVAHLWRDLPINYSGMHDRAGNVATELTVHRKSINGGIRCSAAPGLDHPVLLPSGELSLCCMDYSLRHIVGNLAEQSLTAILRDEPLNAIREQQRQGGDVLCRNCVCAEPA